MKGYRGIRPRELVRTCQVRPRSWAATAISFHRHAPASMTVAAGHIADDEPAAMLTVGAAAAPAATAVKPKALASSPQLATATPTRVRMTFIGQPFRRVLAHEPR